MKKLLFFILFISFVASCNQAKNNINIKNIDVDINILRLDKDLNEIVVDSIASEIITLEDKYGDFFKLYSEAVIRIGSPDMEGFSENLKLFITDYSIFHALSEVSKEYPDIKFIENGLENAFKHYKHYFPEMQIPNIFTMVTGFNQSIVVDENTLAISLDKYLGQNNEVYERLMVSNYLRQNMHRNMIISDCMKAWALTEFPFNGPIDNLINNMLYYGKIHYFQEQMLPELHDSIIMGFNKEQLGWCHSFEKKMWEYMVENKLFFETNFITIQKFTRESPYTKEFGKDSPGRALNWLGWQIIKSYMKKNPEVGLEQLMNNNNYQDILMKAKYRP